MNGKLSRRQLVAWPAAVGIIAAHEHLAGANPVVTSPRIVSLDLKTSAPLPKMKEFYGALLGLPIAVDKPDRLTIRAGETPITFTKAASGDPFYHFAFNIPENKILTAHKWQKERTPLLPIPEQLRDSRLPDDVVNYSHWNAHSIFFFDPAGNVVEYIARHDLKNSAPGGFSSKDILYASEIAFVVDDVDAASKTIRGSIEIEQYRGGSDQFAALGDEHGLVLLMKRGRMISFSSPVQKNVTVYPTKAVVLGVKSSQLKLEGFPYELTRPV